MSNAAQTVTLQLDVFEGPLDLLLYLIKKNDLEISQISLSQVTDQYLQYLGTFEELNIDLASEFLVMAAELAHIKSKMLLPGNDDGLEDQPEETGQDLITRLKQYQLYKVAALQLGQRHWLGRDVFKRGELVLTDDDEQGVKTENFEVDTFDLISAFAQMLKRVPVEKRDHRVMAERVSVTERMYEVLERLKSAESLLFDELFAGARQRVDYVVTFLAILEMARLKMVRIFQTGSFAPIRLQKSLEEVGAEEALAQAKDDFK